MRSHGPGAGWTSLSGGVFERRDGLRVHVLGLCRLSDGRLVSGMAGLEHDSLQRLIRINGGNVRRGTMAWAARLASDPR